MEGKTTESQINIVDLFIYCLKRWYWFVICVALCVGYAYYRYARTPMVYQSNATIIIKDPSNTQRSARLDGYSNLINQVSMSNEMLTLRSKSLMADVVRTMNADVSYTVHDHLRDVELYDRSPVKMNFERDEEAMPYFDAMLKTDGTGMLRLEITSPETRTVTARLGDTLEVAGVKMTFLATRYYETSLDRGSIHIVKSSLSSAVNSYLSRFGVAQTEPDGTILNLSIQDYSVRRGTDILNTIVDKYNEMAIEDKNRVVVNTAEFIEERLQIIQEELGDVENDLASYRTSQRLINADSDMSSYLDQSRGIDDEIVKVEAGMELIGNFIERYEDDFRNFDTIPVLFGVDDDKTVSLVAQYKLLVDRRRHLIDSSSPESPAVKDLEEDMRDMQEEIILSLNNARRLLEYNRDKLLEKERATLRKFTAMPAKASQILSIERQQNIKESLYMFLLNRREENELTQAMVDTNARMLDPAEGSQTPVYPVRAKMLLLALLIGLFVPAVILLARVFLDNKISGRKDVEAGTTIPFMGEVPELKGRFLQPHREVKGEMEYLGDQPVLKEAVRMLCTNINFMCTHEKKSVVMMTTSCNVGAGKSFVARNIASCMADSGKKVLLIDGDLRKQTLSHYFGVHHQDGLANYIAADDDNICLYIIEAASHGVDILPAGHMPPNPTELLGRGKVRAMLDFLRGIYDFIIIDGTPANILADSFVLGNVVDLTLFVLRNGCTDRRILPDVQNLFDDHKLNNMSIVLNGVSPDGLYGYSYGYGYGYGRSYGGYSYVDKK